MMRFIKLFRSSRGLIYIFLFAFFSIFFISIDIIFTPFFPANFNVIANSLFLAFIVILLYPTLADAVDYFVHKNFFPLRYNFKQQIQDLGRKATATLQYSELIQKLMDGFVDTLAIQQVGLFLKDKEHYQLERLYGFDTNVFSSLELTEDHEMVRYLRNRRIFYSDKNLNEVQDVPFSMENQVYIAMALKTYQDEMIGILLWGLSNDSRFFQYIETDLLLLTRRTASAIRNAKLYEQVHQESVENSVLLEIGKRITTSLQVSEILESIMNSLWQVIPYDAAGIFLFNEEKQKIEPRITRGYNHKSLRQERRLTENSIISWSIKNQKGIIIPDVTKNKYYFKVRESTQSEMVVPMEIGEKIIGVFNLESDEINTYRKHHLKILTAVSSQASIAIENARLHKESMQKQFLENEVKIAAEIQNALLPKHLPKIEGLSIFAKSIPSQVVGGDLYDLIRFSNDRLGIAIGDVSGKGIPAAILMASVYANFRGLIRSNKNPSEVMAQMNNLLYATTEDDRFATFFYGIYHPNNQTFTYTSGGHNPPIIIDCTGNIRLLKTGGPLLGFVEKMDYNQETVKLSVGDTLFFYTDGITEAINDEEDFFDEKRLIHFLQKYCDSPPWVMKDQIFEEIKHFTRGIPHQDDMTVIILRIEE